MEYPVRCRVGRCRNQLSAAVRKLAIAEERREKIIEIYWCSHVMLPYSILFGQSAVVQLRR